MDPFRQPVDASTPREGFYHSGTPASRSSDSESPRPNLSNPSTVATPSNPSAAASAPSVRQLQGMPARWTGSFMNPSNSSTALTQQYGHHPGASRQAPTPSSRPMPGSNPTLQYIPGLNQGYNQIASTALAPGYVVYGSSSTTAMSSANHAVPPAPVIRAQDLVPRQQRTSSSEQIPTSSSDPRPRTAAMLGHHISLSRIKGATAATPTASSSVAPSSSATPATYIQGTPHSSGRPVTQHPLPQVPAHRPSAQPAHQPSAQPSAHGRTIPSTGSTATRDVDHHYPHPFPSNRDMVLEQRRADQERVLGLREEHLTWERDNIMAGINSALPPLPPAGAVSRATSSAPVGTPPTTQDSQPRKITDKEIAYRWEKMRELLDDEEAHQEAKKREAEKQVRDEAAIVHRQRQEKEKGGHEKKSGADAFLDADLITNVAAMTAMCKIELARKRHQEQLAEKQGAAGYDAANANAKREAEQEAKQAATLRRAVQDREGVKKLQREEEARVSLWVCRGRQQRRREMEETLMEQLRQGREEKKEAKRRRQEERAAAVLAVLAEVVESEEVAVAEAAPMGSGVCDQDILEGLGNDGEEDDSEEGDDSSGGDDSSEDDDDPQDDDDSGDSDGATEDSGDAVDEDDVAEGGDTSTNTDAAEAGDASEGDDAAEDGDISNEGDAAENEEDVAEDADFIEDTEIAEEAELIEISDSEDGADMAVDSDSDDSDEAFSEVEASSDEPDEIVAIDDDDDAEPKKLDQATEPCNADAKRDRMEIVEARRVEREEKRKEELKVSAEREVRLRLRSGETLSQIKRFVLLEMEGLLVFDPYLKTEWWECVLTVVEDHLPNGMTEEDGFLPPSAPNGSTESTTNCPKEESSALMRWFGY